MKTIRIVIESERSTEEDPVERREIKLENRGVEVRPAGAPLWPRDLRLIQVLLDYMETER